jgi:phosphate/sulfate permease
MAKQLAILCSLALILTGCGSSYSSGSNNGGGGGGGTSYTGDAQGVYSGTSSNGYTFETILLPNDKFYAIYGTVSGNTFTVYGMMTGHPRRQTN